MRERFISLHHNHWWSMTFGYAAVVAIGTSPLWLPRLL